MTPGLYLFCLAPASPPPVISGVGIDGEHPLFVEIIGEVAAVMAAVDLDDFSGPAAQAKITDLAWVAPRALRHEEVVMAVMAQGPVLPVRFNTVFSSLAAAVAPLQQRQDVLTTFFRETAGTEEWILKAFVNLPQARARLTAARLETEKEQLEGLAPGKRYFFEQKIKGIVEKETSSWVTGVGREIEALAQGASAEFSKCRVQSREVTGRDEEMFFHGALLVAGNSLERLEAAVAAWNGKQETEGIQLELSGPWPPYHFAPAL